MIEQNRIEQLLSNYKLIVPEIQREYVWGDKAHIDAVLLPFLKNIDYNLAKCIDYNIGFLYSYTFSGLEKYIIDGQQRITSIILLLYVLSIQESEETRKDFLNRISIEKPIMNFTYNVRPQTESFMRNLFNSGITNEEDIYIQKWFFKSYETDMTIISIVNAVNSISRIIGELKNITYKKILYHITFWYFNVNETSQGEELYITMNSRGQKLTASEQLKPYLFEQWQINPELQKDGVDYGKEWDLWEEMFYQMKSGGNIELVNDAMDRFLQIAIEIENEKKISTLPKKTDVITLPLLSRYMTAMTSYAKDHIKQLLSSKYKEDKVIKSLIAEGLKCVHEQRDAIRIYHIFDNITKRRKYKGSHDSFLRLIHRYSLSKLNFYDFIIDNQELCNDVLDRHELDKILIYKNFQNDNIEETFWETEKSSIWNGNISPLIIWSCSNGNIMTFNFDKFIEYRDISEKYFGDEKLFQDDMDKVRQALLSQKLTNYPRIFAGNTIYSFGYERDEWKTLIRTNTLDFKAFFDKLLSGITLQDMIEQYPLDGDYSEFVKDDRLLKYCHKKKLQYWWGTWFLMQRERWTGKHANIHAYKYYLRQIDNHQNDDYLKSWSVKFYPKDITCTYYDQKTEAPSHIAIDLEWNSGKNHDKLQISCFLRESEAEKTKHYLKSIIDLGYNWENGRYRMYIKMPETEIESFQVIDQLRKQLMNHIEKNHL